MDFALFGPHGRRLLKKLSHAAHLYNPQDGSWRKAELPGPPSIDDWWRSWMVYKCTLLLLDAVKPEPLELYGEHIRSLATDYGPACWFLVYQADVRMRSEEFERLRPDFEAIRGRCVVCGAGARVCVCVCVCLSVCLSVCVCV